ncbi:MAG: response regulator [Candidatus Blackburnbacteria bacterium]|nr:response regulator [Candidatus Blackburnbacteria bacterium]
MIQSIKKVLLVDDDEGIQEAIKALLEHEGFQILIAATEREAVKLIKHKSPEIILMDFLLGSSNGASVAQKLKGNKKTQHIPIIIMSAHHEAKLSAEKCGADDFLAKPFDIDELLEKINRYTT